jgi:hypothetical protein
MTIIEVQPIVETQTITIDVNVVDVNVITRSKTTKEHVFRIKRQGKQKMLLTRRKKNG